MARSEQSERPGTGQRPCIFLSIARWAGFGYVPSSVFPFVLCLSRFSVFSHIAFCCQVAVLLLAFERPRELSNILRVRSERRRERVGSAHVQGMAAE